MGMPAAKVFVEITDTNYSDISAKQIKYYTKTISILNSLFSVNNKYFTITNSNFTQILNYKKQTEHPGLKDSIYAKIDFITNNLIYSHIDNNIPSKIFNIFSFFHYLQNELVINNKNSMNFSLDREGDLYTGELLLKNQNNSKLLYSLSLEKVKNINKIQRKTDIFTWALFLDNSERLLTINKETGILEKCVFSRGFITLNAELISF